jgi:hypothetical protein
LARLQRQARYSQDRKLDQARVALGSMWPSKFRSIGSAFAYRNLWNVALSLNPLLHRSP